MSGEGSRRAGSIRHTVFVSFTLSAVLAIIMTGMAFYFRYSSQLTSDILRENELLIEQTEQSLNAYLRNMMRVSDSLYYDVIKNTDLTGEPVDDKLSLLRNANSAYIESIALFSRNGELLATSPAAILKDNAQVRTETWFTSALAQSENLHFSVPGVQRIFEGSGSEYKWVISLSCAVEITRGRAASTGVLLMDLKYSGLADVFKNYELAGGGYVYLTDAQGGIIFHPQQQLLNSGLAYEDSAACAALRDGSHETELQGQRRTVIVKTVGYTGWRLIGVVPGQALDFANMENTAFLLLVFCCFFLFMIVINSVISTRITDPIAKLEQSVMELERGIGEGELFIGGSAETRSLGRSIQRMVVQRQRLSEAIMREQDQKQRSEMKALQAQINPHFLYNTLDIIIWMVENEKPGEAVRVVSALARFFRISLSGGRDVISVSDEIWHVRSYLMIQHMRYRDRFRYTIEVEPEAENMRTVKLVLQPIVENAIYHGMEYKDGDGLIAVRAWVEDGRLMMSVSDNGLGMPPEVAARLLGEDRPPSKTVGRGSGVGLKNVHDRIRLYYGRDYGVTVESEPDEGTTVTLTLPAIPYSGEGGVSDGR